VLLLRLVVAVAPFVKLHPQETRGFNVAFLFRIVGPGRIETIENGANNNRFSKLVDELPKSPEQIAPVHGEAMRGGHDKAASCFIGALAA
jgi:hypothetical protein